MGAPLYLFFQSQQIISGLEHENEKKIKSNKSKERKKGG
jgi:hypothetical protein